MVDGADVLHRAPQGGHVDAMLSGLGMAAERCVGARLSARSHVDKMHAIAGATGDALIVIRPVGKLE
jgi:hypothetical protein